MTPIESRKEGSITLEYPLLTKSNYAAGLIKMHVNLQAQGAWDVIEHGDFEECKDTITLSTIYQAVPKGCLARVGIERLDKGNVGDAVDNACGCGTC